MTMALPADYDGFLISGLRHSPVGRYKTRCTVTAWRESRSGAVGEHDIEPRFGSFSLEADKTLRARLVKRLLPPRDARADLGRPVFGRQVMALTARGGPGAIDLGQLGTQGTIHRSRNPDTPSSVTVHAGATSSSGQGAVRPPLTRHRPLASLPRHSKRCAGEA